MSNLFANYNTAEAVLNQIASQLQEDLKKTGNADLDETKTKMRMMDKCNYLAKAIHAELHPKQKPAAKPITIINGKPKKSKKTIEPKSVKQN